MGPVSVLFLCTAVALVGYWVVFHGFHSHDVGLRRCGLLVATAAEGFAVLYIPVTFPMGWVTLGFIIALLAVVKLNLEMMREAFPAPKWHTLPPEVSRHDNTADTW